MFVGDNPRADIDGAKRFGMKTAWVRRGRQFPDDLQPPDYTVDHVSELSFSPFREAKGARGAKRQRGMPANNVIPA